MHPLDPVLLGEGLRSAAITRGDGHQPSARVVGRWDDGALGDAGRTEDSQAKGLTHAGTLARLLKGFLAWGEPCARSCAFGISNPGSSTIGIGSGMPGRPRLPRYWRQRNEGGRCRYRAVMICTG